MTLKLFLIISLTFVFLSRANSQADSALKTNTKIVLAQQLIDLTGSVNTRYQANRVEILKSIMKAANIPEHNRSKVTAQLNAFFDKYQPIEEYKKTFANVYANEFSEQELRKLIEFYNSPTGKKLTSKYPDLLQKAMQISESAVQDHLEELQTIISDGVKE